jgi:hypothetical protein
MKTLFVSGAALLILVILKFALLSGMAYAIFEIVSSMHS